MLESIATPLAIPINNPFPVTLAVCAIGMAAFGVELAFARLRLSQRARLSALLTSCVIGAAILFMWAAYSVVSGPPDAEPVMHITDAPNPFYVVYRTVWVVNIPLALLFAALAFVFGASERRSSLALNPPQP
ncbi:MAG: hypothetical protein ACRDID_06980 [Ktedonobacterales bacterium]